MRPEPTDVRHIIEGLMNEFNNHGGVEWRHVFEGEVLQLVALVSDVDAKALHVTFQDGVRQIGHAGPFDAIACAQALLRDRGWMDASPHGRPGHRESKAARYGSVSLCTAGD